MNMNPKGFLFPNVDSAKLNLPKNSVITGTFDSDCFQISLAHIKDKDNKKEDPLDVPLFDLLGYHTITHCGVYGEEYNPFVPIVVIRLPFVRELISQLPKNLIEFLPEKEYISDFYVMVHPYPEKHVCQHFVCDETWEMNIVSHCWVFSSVEFTEGLDVQEIIQMGLFDTFGVAPTHQDFIPELAGIPFENIGPRVVGIHFQRFSPANAQLLLKKGSPYHSFICLLIHHETKRLIVTYHLLPGDEALANEWRESTKNSQTLKELLENLYQAYQKNKAGNNPIQKIVNLITPLFG